MVVPRDHVASAGSAVMGTALLKFCMNKQPDFNSLASCDVALTLFIVQSLCLKSKKVPGYSKEHAPIFQKPSPT